MKRKINKLTIVLLIILQVFATSSSVFAVDNGESVLLYPTEKMDYIRVGYWGQDLTIYHTVYAKDGKEYPVYCIDYAHKGITDERKYNVKIKEEYINENNISDKKLEVWRVIQNGYPFKKIEGLNDYEAYAATKLAVFYVLEDWEANKDKIYYKNEEGKTVIEAMYKILESARNSTKVPTSTKIDISKTDWQIDEIDNKFLSTKITLNSQTAISQFSVTIDENMPEGTIITDLKNNKLEQFKNCKEFKILIPLENLTEENEFTVKVQGDMVSYPMYFGEPEISGVQNYVLTAGRTKCEGVEKLIQYPKNKTKLIIEKQDLEGNILPGVKFNILDFNKNIVFENLQTNENGIIELNTILPGTYYIQEIESIEGYEINNEIIEIEVGLNEEEKIVVTNEKIPEEPEVPEEPEEPEKPEIPEEPEIPEIPEEPKVPEIPETPEIIKTPEPPKLPRTGW